jgi:hypothetical protein
MRSYISKAIGFTLVVMLTASQAFAAKADAQPATASPAPLADPCWSATLAKQSDTINLLGSTENIELIAASSQGFHVCGFLIDGGQFVLFSGGGLNCSWNPVPLFGPTVTSGKNAHLGTGNDILGAV